MSDESRRAGAEDTSTRKPPMPPPRGSLASLPMSLIHRASALAAPVAVSETEYTTRDTVLYALACGSSRLDQVFEQSPKFHALPTFLATLSFRYAANPFELSPSILPSIMPSPVSEVVDLMSVLHGEEDIVIHAPLSPAARVREEKRILDVSGKGKNAVVVVESLMIDCDTGVHLATARRSLFCLGTSVEAGGPPAHPPSSPPSPPRFAYGDRPPDLTSSYTIPANAALLYRLTGDTNPLHIDPAVSSSIGFPTPILHGLATLGISVRLLLDAVPEPSQSVRRIAARFSKPVVPGQSVDVRAWRTGAGLRFRALVGQNVVLDNGLLEFSSAKL